LSRIEAQWPAPGTLSLIEELVFRKPGKREEAFDLPAYHELLLLYTVARDVIEPDAARTAVAAFPAIDDSATLLGGLHAVAPSEAPSSVFGAIEHGLQVDTMPMPPTASLAPVGRPSQSAAAAEDKLHELNLSDLDQTAYQTLRAPIEPEVARSTVDPHVIDFDPFDPATEAEIAPRPKIIKR
jgi:hypothetical protein